VTPEIEQPTGHPGSMPFSKGEKGKEGGGKGKKGKGDGPSPQES